MSDNLIIRTLDVMERYDFKNIRIFCNKKLSTKSLAPAFALNEFLQHMGIDSKVVINRQDDLSDIYTDSIPNIDLNRFLAISIDCKKEIEIENNDYRNSSTLINIVSPLHSKGYGVLNFKSDLVSGTAEYLVDEIFSYCKENQMDVPMSVAEWLYLGIIGTTRRFGANIKQNTMLVAKQLIDYGIDYGKVCFLYEKQNISTIRCQEMILRKMIEKPNYIYAIVPLCEYENKYSQKDFTRALSLFKNINECYMTALFIEQDDETYKVLLASNEYYKADVKHVARKNNGEGEDLYGEAIIQDFDVNKVLGDIDLACEKINKKFKEVK